MSALRLTSIATYPFDSSSAATEGGFSNPPLEFYNSGLQGRPETQ